MSDHGVTDSSIGSVHAVSCILSSPARGVRPAQHLMRDAVIDSIGGIHVLVLHAFDSTLLS